MTAGTAAQLARIQALRSKTTDRGCTEQEAMAAAAKAAELLDQLGLSMSELELKAQPCERRDLPTGRSRIGPLDECAPAVAAFFDCRLWFETDPEGRLTQVFFGLPADVHARPRRTAAGAAHLLCARPLAWNPGEARGNADGTGGCAAHIVRPGPGTREGWDGGRGGRETRSAVPVPQSRGAAN